MALGGMGLGSFIDGLYQTYLGRAADAEGRSFWENSGLSEDQLIAQFSAQGQQSQPAPAQAVTEINPRTAYVQGLYRDLLGREADAEGLNYWSNSNLDDGAIFDAFIGTPEYRRAEIADYYDDYMGRAADEAGLNYWDSSGQDLATIQRAFYETPDAQVYLAQQQQQGSPQGPPLPAWLQPLAPSETTRSDVQTMAEIWRQYYGDAGAAGMLGNAWKESRLDPNQLQLGPNGQPLYYRDGNPLGFGLFQWEPRRVANFMKFAQDNGFDPYSAEAQARFSIYEHETTERGNRDTVLKRSAQGATSASDAIAKLFLRPDKGRADYAGRNATSAQFLDWIRRGMPAHDPVIQGFTAPLRRPEGTDPQFMPDPLEQPYTPGPGSSNQTPAYQGQYIDPLTGSWRDFGSTDTPMLQPTQTPFSPYITGSLGDIFQPTTIASSSGVQNFGMTPPSYLSDPYGSSGSWSGSLSPTSFGPTQPTTLSWEPFTSGSSSGGFDPSTFAGW